MHSAIDYGYNSDWTIHVQPGLQFRAPSGDEWTVRQWHSRDVWICRCIGGNDIGRRQMFTEAQIIEHAYAA